MPRLTEKDLEMAEERLRDAAEEMLAALVLCLEKLKTISEPTFGQIRAMKAASAAIARAEGRE